MIYLIGQVTFLLSQLEKALNADCNHGDYLISLQRAFNAASEAGVATGDSAYNKAGDILTKVSQVTNC